MDPADRGEEGEVRSEEALLRREGEQPGGARVAVLVHVVAEPRDEPAARAPGSYRLQRHRVPAGVVRRERPVEAGQHVVQEAAAVLGDAEEAGAAAEESGREGALHRVRRGEVGQPGHHRGGGEAVVGEGGEHGLEDAGLAGGRPPLGGQPEGEFAEADLAHDLAGQVVAEQGDRLAGGGAEGGGVDGGRGVRRRRGVCGAFVSHRRPPGWSVKSRRPGGP